MVKNKRRFNVYEIYSIYWVYDENLNKTSYRGKYRPGVIEGFTDDGYVLLAKITSKYSNKSTKIKSKYYKIKNWSEAGLNKDSYINVSSVRYIKQNRLHNKIGRLTPEESIKLEQFKQQYKQTRDKRQEEQDHQIKLMAYRNRRYLDR